MQYEMTFRQLGRYMDAFASAAKSVEMKSAPGRGKSTFNRDFVARKQETQIWGFSPYFLATATPVDLPGFMVPYRDDQGRKRAEFTMPTWAQCQTLDGEPAGVIWDYDHGTLFLDEWDKGSPDVKKTAAELLLHGQIGPWKLPKGWHVVAASNRVKDRSGSTKEFDFVINRRCEVNIKDSAEETLDWLARHDCHPDLLGFYAQHTDILLSDGVPKEQGPWLTPRSGFELSELTRMLPGGNPEANDEYTALAAGYIGTGTATTLAGHLKLVANRITVPEIIRDPKNAAVPTDPAVLMTLVFDAATQTVRTNVDKLADYIARIPDAFAAAWMRAVVVREPALLNSRGMNMLTVNKAELLAMLHSLST